MASGTQKTNMPRHKEKFECRYNCQETDKRCIVSILDLSGFRKEELKVQAKGRERSLTVSGQRERVDADKRVVRFRFLLSDICDLGEGISRITATFNEEKGVLALTVPKRPPPAIILHVEVIEGTIKQATKVSKEELAVIEGTIKATEVSEVELAVTEGTKATEVSEEELLTAVGPEADSAEQVAATHKKQQPEEDEAGEQNADQPPTSRKGATPEADSAAPASNDDKEPADAERKSVHRERLLAEERARRHPEQHKVKGRRTEEERASEATAAPEEAKECQKMAAARRGFKERVAEELQGLAGSEWAEGLVDTVNKNKEVIAVAVAAFSVGLLVCRLSSKH